MLGAMLVLLHYNRGFCIDNGPAKDARASLNFDYELKSQLIYIDRLNDGEFINRLNNQLDDDSDAGNSWERRLGLKLLSLDLHWRYLDSSEFHMKLRPDALLDRYKPFDDTPRELDTRIGTSYRSKPKISLLDEYQIVIKPSDKFDITFGVFDRLEEDTKVFNSILDFALEVQHPRKFAALRLGLRERVAELPTPSMQISNLYTVDAYLFEGRGDRAESYAPADSNSELSPSSRDPYWGEAIAISYFPNEKWKLAGLLGNLDTKDREGIVNEVFASLSVGWDGIIGIVPLNIAYSGKWSHERWSQMDVSRPELEQTTHSLTAKHEMSQNLDILWGIHYGVSERHQIIDPTIRQIYRGEKLDLGFSYKLLSELVLKNITSVERRSIKEGNNIEDVFTVDGKKKKELLRFGIELDYYVY